MFKTSLIYFLIRAINGVLALATIYMLTRLLSAEQYGLYALGMAGIGLFGSVLFQWIAVAVSRFYAVYANEPDALLAEAYRLFITIAFIGLVFTVIFAILSPIPEVTPVFALAVGIGAIAMGLHSLGLQIANARGKPISYGLLTVSRGAIALVCAVVLVKVGWGGAGAVFGIAFASVLSATFFGARLKTNVRHNRPELRRQIILYGLPLSLTYLSTTVLDVSDRIMIGWLLGAPAVAGYAASYDLAQQTVGAILNILFLTNYPRITAAWESGGVVAANKAMRVLSCTLQLAMPLLVGIFVGLSTEISKVFFGKPIQTDAALLMPWVAIAITIGCFKTFYLDVAFQLSKKTNMQLRIAVIMAVLNVSLTLVLLKQFGVVGAAMATASSFSFGAFLSWWYGRQVGLISINGRQLLNMFVAFSVLVILLKLKLIDIDKEPINLIVRTFIGIIGFFAVAITIDLAGLKTLISSKQIFKN